MKESEEGKNDISVEEYKYTAIRNICSEFVEIATADAMIIIDEYFRPKASKIIPVVSERKVDGRSEVCGRGVEGGKCYTFEAHNIVYKVINMILLLLICIL